MWWKRGGRYGGGGGRGGEREREERLDLQWLAAGACTDPFDFIHRCCILTLYDDDAWSDSILNLFTRNGNVLCSVIFSGVYLSFKGISLKDCDSGHLLVFYLDNELHYLQCRWTFCFLQNGRGKGTLWIHFGL